MPDMLEIGNIGAIGAVRDVPPYELPPEAWTTMLNMRIVDRGVERLMGHEAIFGAPSIPPLFAFPVRTPTNVYWVYGGTTAVYVWDGVAHTDITRAVGGPYGALVAADWNYTFLGGTPILNNGQDVPQFWAQPPVPATKLADLTNWPADLRGRIVRAVGPYLVAMNLTDTGDLLPHTLQWSHPADPGGVPSSWDYTDPTKDAGRKDLSDTESGIIVEGMTLGSALFIYKESSIWRAIPDGSRKIFDFKQVFETVGALATRCVAVTGDGRRHVFATQDADIMWHNGTEFDSILDERQRKRLANELDTQNYSASFMFTNPLFNEVWFCYPSQGFEVPNRALIWNYKNGQKGVITEADNLNFVHASIGNIEEASEETWESTEDLWDEDTGPWSVLARRRVVVSSNTANKLYQFDTGLTRDGVAYEAVLAREGLAVIGRRRNGEWVVDFEKIKMVSRVLPKIQGGPVRIRLGMQMLVDGPVTWFDYATVDPSGTVWGDLIATGRAIAIEFSTADSVAWRLDSYKLLVNVLGGH